MLVREYGFGLEFCLYVGDGFHHSFGHGFDFSAFDEGIHVSLELVVHFGGDNHPLVAVVADAHGHLAEEAPAFEVGKEVVLRDAGNLAHPVHLPEEGQAHPSAAEAGRYISACQLQRKFCTLQLDYDE